MWAVLQCFGFGEHFISMIKTLYLSPAASVITGNIIFPSIPLQRGMRQGCLLSPLLFCLSLEPLAQAIRKSEVSIKIHDHNHSISLYADDIILYLDHFDVSVSSIIKEFDNFSSLSGYKINWSKSALMPINNVKAQVRFLEFSPKFSHSNSNVYPTHIQWRKFKKWIHCKENPLNYNIWV